MRKPFERVPFAELPTLPRMPHAWGRTESRDILIDSRSFGRVSCHVRTYGSGPPLLLVHGLMTASYSWRYVLEALGAHYTLYMLDLPGAGRSEGPDVTFSADALATWINEVCEALGIVGCDAIGNSMGGYLCMQAALSYPGLFRRLVNIHSPGVPHPRYAALGAALSTRAGEALLRWLVHRNPKEWVWRNVHYFDESLKSHEELEEYATPLSTREGVRAFTRYMREALRNAEMTKFVATLAARRDAGTPFPVPLLLLYSDRDPLVSPKNGDRFQSLIPSAKLSWLTNTSHFAHVDTPEPTVREVMGFFRAP